MGLSFFFAVKGPINERLLKILCLICWGLGGCIYVYGIYEAIFSAVIFPEGTMLITANWLLHVGLRFFVLWVPMGFALVQWEMKRIVVPVVYLLGCLLAIILGVLALVLILEYAKENKVMNEYSDIIKQQIEGKDAKFPPYVLRILNTYHCCGWHDPMDFAPGSMFDISDKINKNPAFMMDVAKCYGETFEVTKNSNGDVIYKPQSSSMAKLPDGCGTMLIQSAYRQVNFIFVMAIFIALFSLMIMLFYIISYTKLPSSQVNTQRNERVVQDLQQGNVQSSIDKTMVPEQSTDPSNVPSTTSN